MQLEDFNPYMLACFERLSRGARLRSERQISKLQSLERIDIEVSLDPGATLRAANVLQELVANGIVLRARNSIERKSKSEA